MLYNPQWKREDVHDLIAWLETKPPEESYDFRDCGRCLVAQWQAGRAKNDWSKWANAVYIGEDAHRIASGPRHQLSDGMIVFFHSSPAEWAYGKALDRARRTAAMMAEAA